MSPAIKTVGLGADDHWHEARFDKPADETIDWYVFADQDAILHPQLATLIRRHAAGRSDIGIFYGDEVVMGASGQSWRYLCKPAFDQTQMLAHDYIGLPLAVSRAVWAALGGFDSKAGAAQCYDLLLRAASAGIVIERITEVLAINPADTPLASSADQLTTLRRAVQRSHPGCEVVPSRTNATFELRRIFTQYPELTLVIPTRQGQGSAKPTSSAEPMIVRLLQGLCETDWPMPRLRVLVGDDLADGLAYQARSWPFRLDRIVTPRPAGEGFNYARKINTLWRAAQTEHIVILNDDIEVCRPGWLQALMTFAMDPDVGGVGARLLFPDGTIQHAGMAAGVLGPCTHVFLGAAGSKPSYGNWAAVHREWSMVTGAVFATRRSVLEELNGFDERFALNFNDVDLCLRMRLLGYRIIYTPHAELIHYESASRGKLASPADQTALFMEKWQDVLHDDPAYHPRLSRTTPDIRPIIRTREWWTEWVSARG